MVKEWFELLKYTDYTVDEANYLKNNVGLEKYVEENRWNQYWRSQRVKDDIEKNVYEGKPIK